MEAKGPKKVKTLTVEKVREVAKKLKECEIKPYKGFIGLGPRGFFEIESDEQLDRLKFLKPHSRKHQYKDCKKSVEVTSYKCDDCGRITTLQIFAPRDDDDVCGFCGGKLRSKDARKEA